MPRIGEEAMTVGDLVTLFVQPGCSSCLRAKEFMRDHVPDHQIVDVTDDTGAIDRLEALGVRAVPVVVVGNRYCFAQDVNEVAAFLGVETGHCMLPPRELLARYDRVIPVAIRLAGQVPKAMFDHRALEQRDRSVGFLAYHIIDIAKRYLDGVATGHWQRSAPDMPGQLRSGPEVAADGEQVLSRYRRYAATASDDSFEARVQTYYGVPRVHYLLERSVWHSVQHTRQLDDLLGGHGITPAAALAPADMDGLPLPAGVW